MNQFIDQITGWGPNAWPPHVLATLAITGCYLLGSIPFGFLIGLANGIDIRTQGSGNIGATNTGRLLGKRFGFLAFVLDFVKGCGPLLVIKLYCLKTEDVFTQFDLPVYCAVAAVVGHVFPVWLKFKGGKAGATGLGVGAVLSPTAMLVSLITFLVIVLLTRYVSLGTIMAAIAYALTCVGSAIAEESIWERESRALVIFVIFIALLLILRHASNIKRLFAGTETRIGMSGG